MPKVLELKLTKQANKHPEWSEEKKRAYIYGTMRRTGWVPKRERK